MIHTETYLKMKEKYCKVASWAIWSEEDYSDSCYIESCISELTNKYVFVGLNATVDTSEGIWKAFHCKHQGGSDYKLRDLYNHSLYRGSYMTDIL